MVATSRRVLVVVPCLNEEEAMPALLDRLAEIKRQLAPRYIVEPLVVDDGSVDDTTAAARRSGARVARLARNLGIGGAVQTGLRAALRGHYDCAVQMDGDGQHPPDELGLLLDALFFPDGDGPAPDLVVGSRFLSREGWQSTMLRRLGIAWLSFVLRTVARMPVTDPTSGYRVYGPRALTLFDRHYPYDYPEPESLALARVAGLRVREVQVKMRERQGGSSSIRGLSTAYYMLKVTLAVVLTYLRGTRATTGARRLV